VVISNKVSYRLGQFEGKCTVVVSDNVGFCLGQFKVQFIVAISNVECS